LVKGIITYNTIVIASWAAFLLVWIVSAFSVKRDIKGGGIASLWYRFWLLRFVVAALIVFVASRVATGTPHYSTVNVILSRGFFTPPLILGWFGACLAALGVLFAIWARVHLGTNWSPAPAVKEDHQLVTSGPYAFERHPIYTGVILAGLGSALTGTTIGIAVCILGPVLFSLRIRKEEAIMLELFPEYPACMKRTKRLIPYIW